MTESMDGRDFAGHDEAVWGEEGRADAHIAIS
jgi:hypothetical protein